MASNGDTNLQSTAADANLKTPDVREFLAHGSSSSGLSKEEVLNPIPRGATREFREDDTTSPGLSKSEAPARKPRGASQERRDSLTQQTSISVSPTKRSRLSSTDTPRKAPLRATTLPLSDSDDEDYNSGRKRPKAKQQRLSVKPNSAVKAKRTQHSSTPTLEPKNMSIRRREADVTDLEKYQDEPPHQLSEVGLFSPPEVAARSRPRHKYVVPESLQGTAKALGPDTWNDYLVLMERLTLNEISEKEFDKQATPLFQVFDQATRKRLKCIVRDEMVLPVLGQAGQEWNAFDKDNSAEAQDFLKRQAKDGGRSEPGSG